MATALNKSCSPSLSSLFHELQRIDSRLKERVAEARNRDKYWQNDSLRGLFIPETEVADLVSLRLNEKLIDHAGENDKQPESADDLYSGEAKKTKDGESRLDFLTNKFGLSPFEKDVILLAMLPEVDLTYERLFGYIQDDVTRRKPSVDLALNTLCSNSMEKIAHRLTFSSESALVLHHLVEIQEEMGRNNSPLLSKSINLDERVRDFILGLDRVDPNLLPFTRKVKPIKGIENISIPDSTRVNLVKLISDKTNCRSSVLYFWGASGSGKRSIVDALCQNLSTEYLLVETPALLAAEFPFNVAIKLLKREAALQQIPVFFHNFDVLFDNVYAPQLNSITSAISQDRDYPGPVFLSGTMPWKARHEWSNKIFIPVELSVPGYEQRKQTWQSHLASYQVRDSSLAASLSSKFNINIGQINQAMTMAHYSTLYNNGGYIKEDDLYDACRQVSSHKLAELAQKIDTHYEWEDIVLPAEQMEQLREICNHVKYRHVVYNEWGFDRKISRGKGRLNALFAGPSGTGKTMAADIMANELKLDLYRIDLASVVSKYIGETEKNLNHIFEEAQDSNSVLFFDEADSLFGKRSEVRDSHDRYANIEIAYLLQKMEDYEGIVILATNLGKNIDEAFARRMNFAVEFPFPDEEQCLQIWQKVFPWDAPISREIDLQFMASQFHVSGGNIKNIALTAAFLAATDNAEIRMEHLILATKREYQKIGKLCTEMEFKQFYEHLNKKDSENG